MLANLNNSTKYIVLKIKPSYNIPHIIAKCEYQLTTIDLYNGIWKTIDNLINNEIYLFFIEAVEGAKINISLFINYIDYKRFDYINIYEYENKNNFYSSFILKNTIYISKKKESGFLTPISYTINSTKTNYLVFSIFPNNTINHTIIKIDVSGGLYELFNNFSKNITKIKPDDDYYFFIKVQQFSFIRFTLTMSNNMNLTKNPFSYMYYSELYQSKIGKNQTINPIIDENQIIVTSSKNVSLYSTQYIYFRIKSLFNIDYMIVNMDKIDSLFDLDNYKSSKGIYSLKKNLKLYKI